MSAPLSDAELRYLAIKLLSKPTARTKQRTIGASNLSNLCDKCLAYDMLGTYRPNPQADRVWMGKEIGTGIHGLLEARVNEVQAEGDSEIYHMLNRAHAEQHAYFADIPGYGRVGGTIDLSLEHQIVDYKSTDRAKLAVLRDYMAKEAGEPVPFGRSHRLLKLSEAEYEKKMASQEYKTQVYYGQLSLYMLGRELLGKPVDRGSIIWVARDGNGFWDMPTADGYDDPGKVHDVWVTTLPYNAAYAHWLISRGEAIWGYLQAGGKPEDMESHEQCWPCNNGAPKRNLDAPLSLNGLQVPQPV